MKNKKTFSVEKMSQKTDIPSIVIQKALRLPPSKPAITTSRSAKEIHENLSMDLKEKNAVKRIWISLSKKELRKADTLMKVSQVYQDSLPNSMPQRSAIKKYASFLNKEIICVKSFEKSWEIWVHMPIIIKSRERILEKCLELAGTTEEVKAVRNAIFREKNIDSKFKELLEKKCRKLSLREIKLATSSVGVQNIYYDISQTPEIKELALNRALELAESISDIKCVIRMVGNNPSWSKVRELADQKLQDFILKEIETAPNFYEAKVTYNVEVKHSSVRKEPILMSCLKIARKIEDIKWVYDNVPSDLPKIKEDALKKMAYLFGWKE